MDNFSKTTVRQLECHTGTKGIMELRKRITFYS